MAEWRSSTIVLAAIGAAGVAGCSRGEPCEDYLSNVYANDNDCRQDYPNGPCRAERFQDGVYIFGPWYAADRAKAKPSDPGPGASAASGGTTRAIATDRARRRGFGAKGETTACSS